MTRFGNLHRRRESSEAATNDRDPDSITCHCLEDSSKQTAGAYESDRGVDTDQ